MNENQIEQRFSANRVRWGFLLLAISLAPWSRDVRADEPKLVDPNSLATREADMKAYRVTLQTHVSFEMLPISGGEFLMGSPASEEGRGSDEGPQHKVSVSPFWMAKHEVTWDQYDLWGSGLDAKIREHYRVEPTLFDKKADLVTQPTPAYHPVNFEMGRQGGYPAICMTQFAARLYCEWLSAKTGHYYRLPTEAEWEYACRAGTEPPYSFGDASKIEEYAWLANNSKIEEGIEVKASDEVEEDEAEMRAKYFSYHKVGKKKPNPWGLHDMHGNVAEWCLDQYSSTFYAEESKKGPVTADPLVVPDQEHPRVVRGGSYLDEAPLLRSASRVGSRAEWKKRDPQSPKSVFYLTDARRVGFRVIRPLKPPSDVERKSKKLDAVLPSDAVMKSTRDR